MTLQFLSNHLNASIPWRNWKEEQVEGDHVSSLGQEELEISVDVHQALGCGSSQSKEQQGFE